MSTPPRPSVTAADLEATRLRLQYLATELARTEDRVAETFEQLALTRGDPDGHRLRIAAEARRSAAAERRRASGTNPSREDV
jgi:hypothetical protein